MTSALVEPPFASARAAVLPDLLEGDRYVVGSALMATTGQGALVAGFVGGGALVATIGTSGTLLVDAATFLTSAALVRLALPQDTATAPGRPRTRGAVREVLGSRELRGLVLVSWVATGAVVAAEGLAVPVADARGGGDAARGLLLAAAPAGCVVGSVLLARLVAPARRLRLVRPLALLATASVAATPLVPGFAGVLALWFVAGTGLSFNLVTNAVFVRLVRPDRRGRAFAVANGGLMLCQGGGIVAAGALAAALPPAGAVCAVALAGLVAVAVLPLSGLRAAPSGTGTADAPVGVGECPAVTAASGQQDKTPAHVT